MFISWQFSNKISFLFGLICFGLLPAQEVLFPVKGKVSDVLIDEFSNVYVFRDHDFSFTKHTSTGNVLTSIRLTQPFKVQSVENPLSIFLFSENAQELKILDSNLNEIQRLSLIKTFEHIKAAYVEDLQYVWLLDDSRKQLIQYQYRDEKIVNAFPIFINMDQIVDVLVYQNLLYLLRENKLEIYSLKGQKLIDFKVQNARKLRREKNAIYVIAQQSIYKHNPNQQLKTMFFASNFKIVEKNSTQFLAWIDDKFYLYPIEK